MNMIVSTCLPETFEVDIANTKKLLAGERGQIIVQKDVIVSIPLTEFAGNLKENPTIHIPCKIPQNALPYT
jgi:hypothetical protein